jgi:hypothetical protein
MNPEIAPIPDVPEALREAAQLGKLVTALSRKAALPAAKAPRGDQVLPLSVSEAEILPQFQVQAINRHDCGPRDVRPPPDPRFSTTTLGFGRVTWKTSKNNDGATLHRG